VLRQRSFRAFFGRFPAILRTAAALQSVVERASRKSWDRLLVDRAWRMRLRTVASTASLPRCQSACNTVALVRLARSRCQLDLSYSDGGGMLLVCSCQAKGAKL
jgi:hypothetical protein